MELGQPLCTYSIPLSSLLMHRKFTIPIRRCLNVPFFGTVSKSNSLKTCFDTRTVCVYLCTWWWMKKWMEMRFDALRFTANFSNIWQHRHNPSQINNGHIRHVYGRSDIYTYCMSYLHKFCTKSLQGEWAYHQRRRLAEKNRHFNSLYFTERKHLHEELPNILEKNQNYRKHLK